MSAPFHLHRFGEAPSWSVSVEPGASFPRWVDEGTNLREVAPGLYVGDMNAVRNSRSWGLVVDLCGSSSDAAQKQLYPKDSALLRLRLEDGHPIPWAVLDAVRSRTERTIRNRRAVLVHCAAGLSRSASVAYGLLRVGWRLSHDEARRRILCRIGVENGYPMPETFDSARRWADRRIYQDQVFGLVEHGPGRDRRRSWSS